jgi:hypothetical protein
VCGGTSWQQKGKRRGRWGWIYDWSTLYACMKIEQWNLLKVFKKGGR